MKATKSESYMNMRNSGKTSIGFIWMVFVSFIQFKPNLDFTLKNLQDVG